MSLFLSQTNYERLRGVLSERTQRTVFWTGAGLSTPADIPDWRGLRGALSSELEKSAKTRPTNERVQLTRQLDEIGRESSSWVEAIPEPSPLYFVEKVHVATE